LEIGYIRRGTSSDANVRLNGSSKIGEIKAHLKKLLAIRLNYELFVESTSRIDFSDSLHRPKCRSNNKFLQGFQLGQSTFSRKLFGCAIAIPQCVGVNLAQAVRLRRETWKTAFWQPGILDTFLHKLPSSKQIGTIMEDEGNLGDPKRGKRSGLFQTGHPAKIEFKRSRNAPLAFLGRKIWNWCQNLNLHTADIRPEIERKAAQIESAKNEKEGESRQNGYAVA